MSTMTQAQYECAEAERYRATIRRVEEASLEDRRAGRTAYAEALAERPEQVAERAGWILGGHYGYGAQQAALAVARNTRSNRPAALGQMVAALEYLCPARFAREAWSALPPDRQQLINRELLWEMELELATEEPSDT